MTTQKLNLFRTRRASATYFNRWIIIGRRMFAQPVPSAVPVAPATVAVPVKGDTRRGSMLGRKTPLRVPFDTFAASILDCPNAAGINDGETLTINDGLRELVFEIVKDAGPPPAPGHIAWPITTGETAVQVWQTFWALLNTEIDALAFDVDAVLNSAPITADGMYMYSRRSHPGMYGRGALFATTIVGLVVNGWGAEYQAGERNAWGRSWFPIRWGLKRGWTANRGDQYVYEPT